MNTTGQQRWSIWVILLGSCIYLLSCTKITGDNSSSKRIDPVREGNTNLFVYDPLSPDKPVSNLPGNIQQQLNSYFGSHKYIVSEHLDIRMPVLVESGDGSKVPVSIYSDTLNFDAILLLVEELEAPLISYTVLEDITKSSFSTTIRMFENIHTIYIFVRSGDNIYGYKRRIYLNCGGCLPGIGGQDDP